MTFFEKQYQPAKKHLLKVIICRGILLIFLKNDNHCCYSSLPQHTTATTPSTTTTTLQRKKKLGMGGLERELQTERDRAERPILDRKRQQTERDRQGRETNPRQKETDRAERPIPTGGRNISHGAPHWLLSIHTVFSAFSTMHVAVVISCRSVVHCDASSLPSFRLVWLNSFVLKLLVMVSTHVTNSLLSSLCAILRFSQTFYAICM